MASAVIALFPARDVLGRVIADAIAHREPDRSGCCAGGRQCALHDGEQSVADALCMVLAEVDEATSDEEAVAAVLGCAGIVFDEIAGAATGREMATQVAGATEDDEIRAAITGGADGGTR